MSEFLFDGHIDRPNHYKHTCLFCGKLFIGRKNRKYCPPPETCKQDFDNINSTLNRARISEDLNQYGKNEIFLHKHCSDKDYTVSLDLSFVKKSEFKFDSVYKVGKDEEDGYYWFQIGSYEYRVDKKKNKMLIRKYIQANGNDSD